MKLHKMDMSDTEVIQEMYKIGNKDLVVYHCIEAGIFGVYEESGIRTVEYLDKGKTEYSPEMINHMLETVIRSTKVTRPETIFIKEMHTGLDKMAEIFLLIVTAIIVILIIEEVVF